MSSISASLKSTKSMLAARFQELYSASPSIFCAPGRVNLIGEHTDYNDGLVMPMAIGFHTWVAAAKRDDQILQVHSDHFDESVTLSLNALTGPPRQHWSDFIRGVAAVFQAEGYTLCGANLAIHGEVPLGAGLSSSASLEVAVALALTSLSEIAVPRLDLVKLCQRAEHEYVGTRCGIMDQFAAGFGVPELALMLDCRSLEYRSLPLPPDVRFVVCNSMVRHEHASGEYNLRRADSEAGVKLLQPFLPGIRALRDVNLADLEKHKSALPEIVYRRCRHVITENERVLAAAEALQSGDPHRFGLLMYQSHKSLRDDYEVSCPEIDVLVDAASSIPGVYGSRITGGGLGGCTVTLMRADSVSAFRSEIAAAYARKTGINPEIYVCDPAPQSDLS